MIGELKRQLKHFEKFNDPDVPKWVWQVIDGFEKKHGWVRLKDKKPNIYDEVIIAVIEKSNGTWSVNVDMAQYYGGSSFYDKEPEWVVWNDWEGEWEVIAWHPLPEIPEELKGEIND